MTNDINKEIHNAHREEYAIALAGMPTQVREGITSDPKLNAIAFGFFRLGHGAGMLEGLRQAKSSLTE